jgi:hypothetical protein
MVTIGFLSFSLLASAIALLVTRQKFIILYNFVISFGCGLNMVLNGIYFSLQTFDIRKFYEQFCENGEENHFVAESSIRLE